MQGEREAEMGGRILFLFESVLLGAGLAMDAFSVSIADGLQEPGMRRGKALRIAGAFGFFQFLMPLVGWACVRAASERFLLFRRAVPLIAFGLLLFIGGKMLLEGLRGPEPDLREEDPAGKAAGPVRLTPGGLLMQALATSIDAMSVGFTIAAYGAAEAFLSSAVIGLTTAVICVAGIRIGRFFGMRLAGRASVLGRAILIAIGIRILVSGSF